MMILSVDHGEISLRVTTEELGFILNALWQELGYQEARVELDRDLREGYENLQRQLLLAVQALDAEGEARSH